MKREDKGTTLLEQDKLLMEQFGITVESKVVFHFGGYRYDRLSDAVNYAKNNQGKRSAPEIQHEN